VLGSEARRSGWGLNMITQENQRKAFHNAKHICFFGIGLLLNHCYDQLVLFLGKEPDLFCDNDPKKWGVRFFGKKCIPPIELQGMRDGMMVIITVRNYEDIVKQLAAFGINNVLIACFDDASYFICGIKEPRLFQSTTPSPAENAISMQGKWTLVTGASRGVGRQIAICMAQLGANIIAHGRSTEHTQEVIAACSSFGVQAVPIAAELGNLSEVQAMLDNLENLAPQVDVIFNNAAINAYCADFWAVTNEDFLNCFTVNTIAPLRICYRLIPAMIKRGFGRVVNISSGIEKVPEEMAYACSKSALNKFAHDLAPSLQNTGVMLSSVTPGWVRTDMGGCNAPYTVESVIPGVLLGALLEEDINGRWLVAQDYVGLSITTAINKAKFLLEL